MAAFENLGDENQLQDVITNEFETRHALSRSSSIKSGDRHEEHMVVTIAQPEAKVPGHLRSASRAATITIRVFNLSQAQAQALQTLAGGHLGQGQASLSCTLCYAEPGEAVREADMACTATPSNVDFVRPYGQGESGRGENDEAALCLLSPGFTIASHDGVAKVDYFNGTDGKLGKPKAANAVALRAISHTLQGDQFFGGNPESDAKDHFRNTLEVVEEGDGLFGATITMRVSTNVTSKKHGKKQAEIAAAAAAGAPRRRRKGGEEPPMPFTWQVSLALTTPDSKKYTILGNAKHDGQEGFNYWANFPKEHGVKLDQTRSTQEISIEDVITDGRPGDALILFGIGLGNFNPTAECILVSHGQEFILARQKDSRHSYITSIPLAATGPLSIYVRNRDGSSRNPPQGVLPLQSSRVLEGGASGVASGLPEDESMRSHSVSSSQTEFELAHFIMDATGQAYVPEPRAAFKSEEEREAKPADLGGPDEPAYRSAAPDAAVPWFRRVLAFSCVDVAAASHKNLIRMASYGQSAMIQELLKHHGTKYIDDRDPGATTALEAALANGHMGTALVLLDHGATPTQEALLRAAVIPQDPSGPETQALARILENSAGKLDVGWRGPHIGNTALHAAAEVGLHANVQALLGAARKAGGGCLTRVVDQLNEEGSTPLDLAASAGSCACLQALLDAGAVPSLRAVASAFYNSTNDSSHREAAELLLRAKRKQPVAGNSPRRAQSFKAVGRAVVDAIHTAKRQRSADGEPGSPNKKRA